MSSYMTAQGLLKTLILTATTTFVTGSVTEGDYRVLDSGYTNSCVLLPGQIPNIDTAGMVREQTWVCIADVFTKFVNDGSYSTFGSTRDALVATIDAAPCLSAAYFVMGISSEGDPQEVYDTNGGGPYFVTQRLRITIQENV